MDDSGSSTLYHRQRRSPVSPTAESHSLSADSSPPRSLHYSQRTVYDNDNGYVEVALDTPDLISGQQADQMLKEQASSTHSPKRRNVIGGFLKGLKKLPHTLPSGRDLFPMFVVKGSPPIHPGPAYTDHTNSDHPSQHSLLPPPPTTRYFERGSPTEISIDVASASSYHTSRQTPPPHEPLPPSELAVAQHANTAPASQHPEIQAPKKLRSRDTRKQGSKSQSAGRNVASGAPPSSFPSHLFGGVHPHPSTPPFDNGRADGLPYDAGDRPSSRDPRKMGSSRSRGVAVTLTQTSSGAASERSFDSDLNPITRRWKSFTELPWVSSGRITDSYRPGLARGGMTIKVSRNGKRRLMPKNAKAWYSRRGASSLWNAGSLGGSEKSVKYIFSPASGASEHAPTIDLPNSGTGSPRSSSGRKNWSRTRTPAKVIHEPTSPASLALSARAYTVNARRKRRHGSSPKRRHSATSFISAHPSPDYSFPSPAVAYQQHKLLDTSSPTSRSRRAKQKRRRRSPQLDSDTPAYPITYPQGFVPYQPFYAPPLSALPPMHAPFRYASNETASTPSPLYLVSRPSPTSPASGGLRSHS